MSLKSILAHQEQIQCTFLESRNDVFIHCSDNNRIKIRSKSNKIELPQVIQIFHLDKTELKN